MSASGAVRPGPAGRLDPAQWAEEALAVLALRLRHEAAVTRALRGERSQHLLGLVVTDDEAEALLDEAAGRLRVSGTAASAAEVAASEERLAARRRADPDGVWCRLADGFDLGEAELDLLLLAAAPALDPRLGRVYGYLADDLTRRYLTPALAQRLLDRHGLDVVTLRRLLAPDSPLVAGGLLDVGPERPLVEAPLRVDEAVLDHLLGDEALPAGLAGVCERLRCPRSRPGPATPRPRADAPEVWLVGGEGPLETGDPGGVVLDVAAALGLDVLVVDAARLGGDARPHVPLVGQCVREARLSGALPVLVGFDDATAAERSALVAGLAPPAVVVTRRPAAWHAAGVPAGRVPPGCWPSTDIPTGTRQARVTALLAGHPADGPAVRQWLAALRRPDLLTVARLLARCRDETSLREALRARAVDGLAGLAEPVPVSVTMDDLVLPARARCALQSLVDRHRTAGLVSETWGLGPVFGRRAGTVALFQGPSGTGKTMAAAAVAAELGLPLVRVDLAGLVSKYIGETEKNLDRVLDAAEAADVVLFFDEADALFGRRSEVQDAHDRYANLETSYLLQRLETFGGVGVLASNLHQNIDEAFLRRLDLVVEFPPPRAAARRALWERVGRTDAPLADDLDLAGLAERFELTGGEIRNCWLTAAHAAAARGTRVDAETLLQAVARELVKAGKPVRRAAFGAHYSALRLEEERA